MFNFIIGQHHIFLVLFCFMLAQQIGTQIQASKFHKFRDPSNLLNTPGQLMKTEINKYKQSGKQFMSGENSEKHSWATAKPKTNWKFKQ